MKINRIITPVLACTLLVMGALSASPAQAAGTPAGTVISNQATVNFTDINGNTLQELSNIVTTTVSQVAGVLVDPDNSGPGSPGAILSYAHRVTNTGNEDDTINLTAVSNQGWTVAIYADVDNDGIFTSGTDTLLGDSDSDGNADPGVLTADSFFDILVQVTVPASTGDGVIDVTTVTGTSLFDGSVSEFATDTTTVAAPTLSVVKSVSPAGDQPPGTTLTYTVLVTNNGSGPASSVVIDDPVPANTTYITGSAGGVGTTILYSTDDGATYVATDTGTVTDIRWTLVADLPASGGSATVSFQVTID